MSAVPLPPAPVAASTPPVAPAFISPYATAPAGSQPAAAASTTVPTFVSPFRGYATSLSAAQPSSQSRTAAPQSAAPANGSTYHSPPERAVIRSSSQRSIDEEIAELKQWVAARTPCLPSLAASATPVQ